jgi:hypothetical protein
VLEFVVSVTLTAQTSGGVDAETSTQYNDRLARRLRRLSTRPILPEDFASMALDIEGVYRAVAIDGYNPADGTTNNERMIAIAAVDAAGVQASTTIKNEIDAYVEANREANFICNMMDPVYTIVDVTFVAALAPGFDQATVQTNAINAVKAYLNKATWGRDPHYTSGQDGDDSSAQTWVQSTTVYYSQVMKAIMDTDGITNVVTLLIGPHLGTLSAADLPIVGPAALADAGTITGTVS